MFLGCCRILSTLKRLFLLKGVQRIFKNGRKSVNWHWKERFISSNNGEIERERRKDWIDKKTLKIKTGGSKREAV